MVEILGTVGSIIILWSGLVKGEKPLRSVNALGAFLMTMYGLLIGKFPVWFLNGALFFVHLRRIYQLDREEQENP